MNMRVLAGFLLAPILPLLIINLINFGTAKPYEATLQNIIFLVFSYTATIIIGFPMYVFLKRNNRNNLINYIFGGAISGLILYTLFFGSWFLLQYKTYPDHAMQLIKNSLQSCIIAIMCGLVSGIVFWIVAIKKRG